MSKIYVFVEGVRQDAILERVILPEVLNQVQFVTRAGGRYSMPSLASSVLVTRQRPVALVLDADTTLTELVVNQKREIESLLRMGAVAVPFAVILAVPSIESILFAAPGLLERVFNKPLTAEMIHRAERDPKRALYELEQGPGVESANPKIELCATLAVEECMRQADADDIAEMRKHPVARELNDFLARVTADQMQPA